MRIGSQSFHHYSFLNALIGLPDAAFIDSKLSKDHYINRSLVGKSFQPFGHGVVGYWCCNEKSNDHQLNKFRGYQSYDLIDTGSHNFADADFFETAFCHVGGKTVQPQARD